MTQQFTTEEDGVTYVSVKDLLAFLAGHQMDERVEVWGSTRDDGTGTLDVGGKHLDIIYEAD